MPERTHEQDVVDARAHLSELKSDYCSVLTKYCSEKESPVDRLPLLLKCQQVGTAYFNYAENFVGNSDLLGAHSNVNWVQGFAEDCAEILRSLPAHFEFLINEFGKLGISPGDAEILPGPTAYANMQRMVKAYLTDDVSRRLEHTFIQKNLPVYGFKNEARVVMSKNPPKPFDHTSHLKAAIPLLATGMVIMGLFGISCVGAGVFAITKNAQSSTRVSLWGATLSTRDVGIALVFIGGICLVRVITKIIKRTAPPKGV